MTRLPGWLWGLLITSLFAVAALLGYALASPDRAAGRDDVTNVPQPTVTVDDADPDAAAPVQSPPRNAPRDRAPDRRAAAAAPEMLSLLGSEAVEIDPDNPRACLRLSSAPDRDRVVDDKAFVRVSPEVPFSLMVEGRSLCLLGLNADQTYSITLLAGFTAQDGLALPADRTTVLSFDPKPGMVGFVGDGIILPRSNDATLGIRAMNVTDAELVVYRVNHRALFDESPNNGSTVLEGDWGYLNDAWRSRVEVHRQDLSFDGRVNEMVETGVSLSDIVTSNGPGAYIAHLEKAGDEVGRRAPRSWRWLYVTDLALASYRSEDALHVTLRSIETAQTQAGAKLVLVARNNDVLAEAQTDANGRAEFPGAAIAGTGNDEPKLVLAYAGGDDFAALDLSRSPLDLTEFDVAGRDASGRFDAYLYAERGIYRPGETVNLVGLVRDASGRAAFDRPGTLRILKPDGTTHQEIGVEPGGMAGALYEAIDIPENAPRGRWTAELRLEAIDAPVARLPVSVEDFAPEQLRLDVRADDAPLQPGDTRDVTIAADFLYGAPGRGLEAELEARIQRDPKPFPGFASYSFGNPAKDYREQLVPFASGMTGEDGRFTGELSLGGPEFRSAMPLRAFVTAGVAEPGGRYVRDSVFIPVRSEDAYVGFDPVFEGGYARRNSPASIDIIAVDADGARIDAEGSLRVIREVYDYQWFRENGRWRYRSDVRDVILSERAISISADAPFRFSEALDWGQYRVEVEVDGVVSGFAFGSGWRRTESTSAPDRMELGVSVEAYRPGDTVALTLDAPFGGVGELVLADGAVRRVVTVDLQEGAQTLRVKTARDWDTDLYAMLTLYRPGEGRVRATRSVGLVHIPIDRSEQRLDVSLTAPGKILPRQTQDVVIRVADAGSQTVYATLAAVDTGILQITDHSPPDPESVLFGKRAFSLDVFDDYARMLAPWLGPDRSGGDSLGGAGLSAVPIRIVSLFDGPIEIENGQATVPLDIPDFQGELTLMAVVWSEDALGSASQTMTVRDPVTVQLSLPRFLAPGDRAVATLALDNVDGRDGTYATNVSADGRSVASASTPLNRGERAEEVVEITSDGIGVQTFSLASQGPDFRVARDYRIETRAPGMPVTVSRVVTLEAGESLDIVQADELSAFVRGSADLRVSASYSPLFDPAPLLAELRRYPYGCSEQVTSVAAPLLASREIGRLAGVSSGERDVAIEAAIDTLLSRQSADGSFGLWREGDGNAAPYLQLYASEFLLDAEAAGFALPEAARERTLSAIHALAKLDQRSSLRLDYNYGMRRSSPDYELRGAERAATAMHLLAKYDRVPKTDVVYLQDRFGKRFESSAAATRLGAALEAIGERERADRALAKAASLLDSEISENYYVTPLTNAAMLLAIPDRLPDDVMQTVSLALPEEAPRYSHTHERAWLVRAAAAGGAPEDAPFAGVDGWVAAGRSASSPVRGDMTVTNTSDRAIYLTVAASGQLSEPQQRASNGAKLSKAMHRMDGSLIKTASIARGERAVIVLEADARGSEDAMFVLADLLPAGFEIETVLDPSDAEKTGAFAWLGSLSEFDMTEARDDRFVASWRYGRRNRAARRAAYVVRAVTEGDFAFPGAYVEDMYRPRINASTEAGRLSITPDGAL